MKIKIAAFLVATRVIQAEGGENSLNEPFSQMLNIVKDFFYCAVHQDRHFVYNEIVHLKCKQNIHIMFHSN